MNTAVNGLSREDIFAAAEESGFKCTQSCCGVPLKLCSTDQWQGDLGGFVKAIERKLAQKQTSVAETA